jgi:serine/threonine-protein kinase HipA
MQKGNVYRNDVLVGEITRDENGVYGFTYNLEYLSRDDAMSISVNLPLQSEVFISDRLFSFFFNMLAEGNIKEIQCRDLKIDPEDNFSRLLKTAHSNTIGSITVKEV